MGIGLLLGVLLAECLLRLLGLSYPNFYKPDEVFGLALRPGAEGRFIAEGDAYVTINSDGLRDREHSREKPPNTLRLAVLGDSYCEALQVPLEQTFWWLAGQLLERSGALGPKRLEVINFGCGGYGTGQEYLTLHHRVWSYAPDVVLLAITTSNDVADNVFDLKGIEYIPYFVHRAGELVVDESFLQSEAYRTRSEWPARVLTTLMEWSRLLQLLNRLRYQLRQARETEEGLEPGVYRQVYGEPTDERWKRGWRITEELLRMIRDEVRERGARLLLVTVSNGIQVHPDPAVRARVIDRLQAEDIFYPDRRFKAIAEELGLPILNLAPELQKYAEQHGEFLHGFGDNAGKGHWNTTGHRAAGELLGAWLLVQLCAGGSHDDR